MSGPLDPTQFTRESAERIANVVRAAELSGPVARPLTFERVDFVRNQKNFRVCTFTGAWATGSSKVVTFKYQTQTPNTASALNLFFPITSTASSGDCAIAKEGTSWFLIDVPLQTATAVFASSTSVGISVASTQTQTFISSTASVVIASGVTSGTVLTDVNLSASLNTASCTVTIGKTLVTASRTFVSGTATAAVAGATATGIFVGSTATSVFVQSTFTATFLRFKV